MPEQLDEEFKKVIDLVLYVFSSLGFENFTAQVSLRDPEKPEKYIGDQLKIGKKQNKQLSMQLKKKILDYVLKLEKLLSTVQNWILW